MTFFAIGLFKKVALADGIAVYATQAFDAAGRHVALSFTEAWAGALAFSFQLYFDFSGYSDMAVGIAALFNIWLPPNFLSPYKATSIIEFWRRWHMTLSRFLRDYLYIPLGGSGRGTIRRLGNLLVTMFLGGLWHGAAWTFVLWGLLHGAYLAVNHGWRLLVRRAAPARPPGPPGRIAFWGARLLTFAAVVFAWVVFRASSAGEALVLVRGMLGLEGVSLPRSLRVGGPLEAALAAKGVVFAGTFPHLPWRPADVFLPLAGLLAICWFLPSSEELLQAHREAPGGDEAPAGAGAARRIRWNPSVAWLAFTLLLISYLMGTFDGTHEFLYYQF
jgi:D-alanyl-lipoteichoic acid acyltransferase DltB (MBOAT superfamily)